MRQLVANFICLLLMLLFLLPNSGCSKSSARQKQDSNDNPTSKVTDTKPDDNKKEQPEANAYPDVPVIPIMTEVDGIPIPRVKTASQTLSIIGKIPADVGNEFAKKYQGKPVTGGELTVRFSAEPGTLNPITESSAVQSYMWEYTGEAFARQNPETLEYEPALAKSWVVEDSVKLSPDYPGKERRLVKGKDKPAPTITISYTALTPEEIKEKKKPQVIKLTTTDKDGKPLGKVWVGLFAKGNIPGFPVTGQHDWSDEHGVISLSGLKTGKYQVHVGAEVFGKAIENKDGTLTVKPLTKDNPLQKKLKVNQQQSLTIQKKEWFNVQYQTIYTYFIHEDAKWSDGTPFTSKDLEFTYAIMHNDFVDGDSLKIYYADVVSCIGTDEKTVRIEYRQQYFKSFEFTFGLAFYSAPYHKFQEYIKQQKFKTKKTKENFNGELTTDQLTPEEEEKQKKISIHGQRFGKYFNTNNTYNEAPLGTGPYIVHKWIHKNAVILRRNPNYWGKTNRGYLDQLTFKFITDNNTAMQALKSGEIDFFWRVTSSQFYESLKGPPDWFKGRFVKASWFSPGFGYIGWNALKPKFQDRRVRLALALLFDANKFIEKKLHGDGILLSGSQYYFGIGYDHSVPPVGYSPEIARKLLANAGWIDTNNDGVLDKDGKDFVFEFWFPRSNTMAEQIAIIQKNYKDAGIIMYPRSLEWASFIEKIQSRDFDVCRLGWAMSLESDPFQIWHGSEAGKGKRGSNHVSFNNPEADKLIEMLRYTLDEKKRIKIHHAFHHILDREQPYLFLYTSKDYGVYHQKFHGVKWYRLRPGFDFKEWFIPKELQRKK